MEELISVRSILISVFWLVIGNLILPRIWNKMPWMRRRQEAQAKKLRDEAEAIAKEQYESRAADRMTDTMMYS